MQESHAGSEVVVPLSGDSGRCCESPGSGARSQKAWCVLRASKGRGSSLPAGQQSGIRCPLQACVLQGRLGEYFKRLFLKSFWITAILRRKVQRFLIYSLTQHMHRLPYYQHPPPEWDTCFNSLAFTDISLFPTIHSLP